MLKKFSGLFLAVLFFTGTGSPAAAEDVSFIAEVDTHTVQAGSPVLLVLTVKGSKDIEPIVLPEIKGFKARDIGSQQQFVFVNGQSEQMVFFRYNLYAMELGRFQIPAISATIDQKTYTTEPINMEVVDQATTSSPGPDNQASVKDKVFIVLSVPTKEYFVGERIPLIIKLYVSENADVNLASNIDFKREGFDVGEIADSRRYQQLLGEENYNTVEFTTYVYPRRPGELTLGPAQLLVRILDRDKSQRRASGIPSVFNDEFLNGFLTSEWRDAMITSEDISLKVFVLPEEGQPGDFSGGVGKFNFDVSVSPVEVNVGDPLTLRMKISGDGSLSNVNFPEPDASEFKFYDPQIREDKGEKILEQVVIPAADQIKEFPPVRFSYFDTEQRTYETIVKGPFPLKVLPADQPALSTALGSVPRPAPSAAAAPSPEEKIGQGISFIKDHPGVFQRPGFYLLKSRVFLGAVFGFIILWLAAFAVYSFRYKLQTDSVFARRFLAPRKARKELSAARQSLDKGGQKEFYDRLMKALQDYLGGKFHKKAAALTPEAMEELLKSRGVNPEISKHLREFLNEGEMVRFASVSVSKEQMAKSFVRVQTIIDYLERQRS